MSLHVERLPLDDPGAGERIYPLLHELRPDLDRGGFDVLAEEGGRQGLAALLAWERSGSPVGATLYRVLATSRGRLLFVDDLVTTQQARSGGVGAALLAECERIGAEQGCHRLELDSGMSNQAAHRFYYRHRMGAIALHFAKPLEGS